MKANTRQLQIKYFPYIKDFNYRLLQINKSTFKDVFSLNIYYIKYIAPKSPNRVSIDGTNNDEDFLYLFLGDVDGRIEENNGIKYLAFLLLQKKQRSIKKL